MIPHESWSCHPNLGGQHDDSIGVVLGEFEQGAPHREISQWVTEALPIQIRNGQVLYKIQKHDLLMCANATTVTDPGFGEVGFEPCPLLIFIYTIPYLI